MSPTVGLLLPYLLFGEPGCEQSETYFLRYPFLVRSPICSFNWKQSLVWYPWSKWNSQYLFLFFLRGSILIFPRHLMNSSCLISVSTWAMGALRGGNINSGWRGGVRGHLSLVRRLESQSGLLFLALSLYSVLLVSGSFLLSSLPYLLYLASTNSSVAIYLSTLLWRVDRQDFMDVLQEEIKQWSWTKSFHHGHHHHLVIGIFHF